MMPDRKMFWRIIRRLLSANRGRLFVILLALAAGAAITAALLNLQVDAKRRLTTEFRALGANVMVAPRDVTSSNPATLDDVVFREILEGARVSPVAFLYLIGDAYSDDSKNSTHVVIAGEKGGPWFAVPSGLPTSPSASISRFETNCTVGTKVAAALHLQLND